MIHLSVVLLYSLFASSLPASKLEEGVLYLEIENIEHPTGTIWIGVYDSEEDFLIKEKAVLKGYKVNHTGNVKIQVEQVKFGPCAVAIMHDINGNGEMDRNWLGIPIEPYAFSKKPRSKWRLPRFKEVVFEFAPAYDRITVALDRW